MRILLIAGTYPPGHCGIGDYTVQLAQSLSTLPQYSIGILSASQAPESINAIDIIQTEGDWKLISLFRMLRGVSKWKPDWVHIQYPSKAYSQKILPLILPLLLRAIGIKVIVTLHEAYGWRYFYHFVFLTLPAHKIIFVRSNYLNLIPSIFARYLKFKKFRIISNASSLPLSKMTIEEKID